LDPSLLSSVLVALLPHIPVLLVWLVGALVALFRPSLPRRVVALLVGGLSALCFFSVVGIAASVVLPRSLMRSGHSVAQVGLYLGIWSAALSIIMAAAWVLVLLAVFADRDVPRA
jgi:hypothetical protein